MGYRISEDLVGASEVKIHKEGCGFVHRKGSEEGTETTKWHGPYEDYDEAKSTAESVSNKYKKGWRNAECCMTKA
jgi:hypothetical protein